MLVMHSLNELTLMLCHGNLTVLNLLSVSVTKNQHFRPWRKNYALDRKMNGTFHNCHDILCQHAKFGEIELRALAVGAKIGVFLVCHAWSA